MYEKNINNKNKVKKMAERKRIVRSEILINSILKKQLAKELSTSRQTVHLALIYANNSKLGKSIRKRAKELLQKEADDVKDFE